MEERKNIFDYGAQVFVTFGVAMICMMCFTHLFGESAKGISSFFVLGKDGVPTVIMLEFFLLSVFITAIRYFFFTGHFIKRMPIVMRTVCMILVILLGMIVFIVVFGWFPFWMWQPWVMFFLNFGLCVAISMAISIIRTRTEERKLAEGLARVKKQFEKQEGK